jgi:hypothetical protein
MAELKNPEKAKETFETICATLDHHDWKYQKDEEKLLIGCSVRGEDLPMELTIRVDADRSVVMMFSRMPFAVQEDKRVDLAIAITAVNNALADGCFDYDIGTGDIYFRITNAFVDSTLSEAVFGYMIYCACRTIDDYNDKFLMLGKGALTVEQFLASLAG